MTQGTHVRYFQLMKTLDSNRGANQSYALRNVYKVKGATLPVININLSEQTTTKQTLFTTPTL